MTNPTPPEQKPKDAERYALTRQTEKKVIEIIAFPDSVEFTAPDGDVELTPDEAETFARHLQAAAAQARIVEWVDIESDDPLQVRVKASA